ncbi:MAG: type II secretion system GspH family protein [Candidatus Muirbacterium halophilum]|nr:type II secretion system GspH family protein [Candidatus Muirbacterium halophilum]MCK9475007.1 type II secretion system GspH family protein [Candidatus Muirbacterium halophilum]
MKRFGFTLIELVVIMGIIIILTGAATLYLPNLVGNAEGRALEANLNNIRKVIDDYYKDFGKYPANLKVLTQENAGGYIYLRKIPVDPTTKNPDWEVSENGVNYYSIDSSDYSFVAYIRSSNKKYNER